MRPLQEFVATEAAGGVLLLAATAAALLWANVPDGAYASFWDRHLDVPTLHLTLREWVNDALMALFFFVAGMELKRELVRGELSERRRAALPVIAAVGGMVVPALVYLSFNAGTDTARGWGVPMATDIAFVVGVLALLGPRVPLALKVFVLALAIADDIGAIVVIALFYTDDLAPGWLAAAAAVVSLVAVLPREPRWTLAAYCALGLAAWYFTHESGVHATMAGVAMGLAVPVSAGRSRNEAEGSSAVYRLEHLLHPWTSFVIVPMFALANASIDVDAGLLRDAGSSRVTAGVALGLMFGKPVGITLFSLAAVRLGAGSLPGAVRWIQLVGASMVAGIGFTVSIFIAGLALDSPLAVEEAKIGVFGGSAFIAVAGYALLRSASTYRNAKDADGEAN